MEKVDLSTKRVMIIDCGLFEELAITIAKDFKEVLYFTEWRSSFPSKKGVYPGVGLEKEGIIRCNDWASEIDKIDLFIFPDIYYGGEQVMLRKMGKNVFGGGMGDELELWRNESKKHFKKIGLPVSPYEVIIGMNDLRKYLKEYNDQYVKVSAYRGDFETFHSENYKLSEPILDDIEHNIGAMKYDYEFIVEEAVDDIDEKGENHIVESGTDQYSIDGVFPDNIICGYEIKDLGYCGAVNEYKKLSPLLTSFNNKIAKTLKNYVYRGFISTELRIGREKISYMEDLCCRMGSPPNELYQNMITNLPEIMWYGSQGIMIQPKYKAKYGIEVMIHSNWASEQWQAVHFPKEIREKVKLRNFCKIGETYYIVPQTNKLPEIGAIVEIGDSKEECIEKVTEIAKEIKGYCLDVKTGSIDEMNEVIEKGEKLGIHII